MGCDGGTIPTRDELVRLKKKPEQKDKDADLAHKWNNCALSTVPLRQPIVACELGRLYNKESVLEVLLDRSAYESAASFTHIRTLKDVKTLSLTENPEFKEQEKKGDAYQDKHASPYICPVTGLSMNGRFKFVFLHGCGCVMAERAIKETKSETCLKCGASYSRDDVIVLNGTEEEVETMAKNMEARRQVARLLKKAKKGKKSTAALPDDATADEASSAKKPKLEEDSATEPQPSSSKLVKNGHSSKDSKSSKVAKKDSKDAESDKKSIQKDPKASQTFKSLFTSHPDCKKQPQGHWVTFNPQYFH